MFLQVSFLYFVLFIILSTKFLRYLMSFIFLRNDYFILKRGSAIPYDEIQGRQEKGKESMRAPVLTTEALEGTNQYFSFMPLFFVFVLLYHIFYFYIIILSELNFSQNFILHVLRLEFFFLIFLPFFTQFI